MQEKKIPELPLEIWTNIIRFMEPIQREKAKQISSFFKNECSKVNSEVIVFLVASAASGIMKKRINELGSSISPMCSIQ